MLVIDLEDLYFEWLLGRLDPDGVEEGVAYLCDLLHNCEFNRRVGNDINRANDGEGLRHEFMSDFSEANFDPHVSNELMRQKCSWFEMLVAFSRALDFTYDGGVEGRFLELLGNVELDQLANHDPHRTDADRGRDQHIVDSVLASIDASNIEPNGLGGLFPLLGFHHLDQRGVELWDQASTYFNERL